MLFAGYARRNSLDQPEIRRRTASLSTPHRASDIQVDPDQAALLFRDARGVSIFDFIYLISHDSLQNLKNTKEFTISLFLAYCLYELCLKIPILAKNVKRF